MPSVDISGRSMAYRQTGSGPDVVLLHGLLMDADMWTECVEAFSDSYRVTMVEAPGHGDSDPVDVGYDFEQYARDVWRVLDAAGVGDTVIGGQSMGGWTSLRCAAMRPAQTRGLILIDTSAQVENPDMKTQYEAFLQVGLTDGISEDLAGVLLMVLFSSAFVTSPRAEQWRRKLVAGNPKNYEAMCRAVFDRPDVSHLLQAITAPAVVIHGEDDIAIPMERAEQIADALGAPLHRIPGAGHATVHERPEIVTPIIREFLDRL